jgi:hypothetical protein
MARLRSPRRSPFQLWHPPAVQVVPKQFHGLVHALRRINTFFDMDLEEGQ